jgi:hypothetical protein
MASLIGTVVSIFKMLLPHVENYFDIDSVWGAPRDPSDKIQHWTNTDVGELVVSAQRCDYRLDEHDEMFDQNCEQFELLHRIIRKHLPSAAADLACAPTPPAPSRKLSIFKPPSQKFAAASAVSDTDKPAAPPSIRAARDIELLVAVSEHDIDRSDGASNRSARYSFAAPQSMRPKAPSSVARAPSGRVGGDDGNVDGDAGRYVAMRDHDDGDL